MSERTAVQNPMLAYAEQIGWEYLSPSEALTERGGESGIFLQGVLTSQLQALNPGVVDAARAKEIIRQLSLLPANIQGNREVLAWLRGERSSFVPSENRQLNVRLADFETPDANRFHVTDEWRQVNPRYPNRADVVFLINGVPVAIAETKNATKKEAIALGVDQLRRYHRETPEMLLAPQIYEVTQLLDFYYGVTWAVSRKDLFNWKDEGPPGDYETRVKAFFDRERFLRLLQRYILFVTRNDVLFKVVLRQHQTRAVEKGVARALDPQKRRGLIWHTQGSGKTLTMISIASRLLREAPGGEKPTVLMLVDRNELEEQLFKNVVGYGIGTVQVATSKADLRDILRSDYRGLIVSTIHKFDDIPANVNTRASIVVLVDEAHRTTGSDLGNYLMGALPNATYIGFTGTPIDRTEYGKGTFKVFGTDDPQGYLDKYSIAESIQDGTTVQLNYALAPAALRVERETLETEFLKRADAEGVSDVAELNAILDRAVRLKEMMKSRERIDGIAKHVAEHFTSTVEPMGFKAFLVAVDREACAYYKQALDRYLPPDYSRVVYSSSNNDSELLKRYRLDEDEEQKIREDFRAKGTVPKILIVTEKLLTGFDAPILYCLYLDKPMRDHVLLQAIARVNRPYEDEDELVKPYGFVLDYVGIFEELEDALAFDSDDVSAVIQNIDVLQALFERQITETAPAYLPLTLGWDDKAKERAIAHFKPAEVREPFLEFFRQLETVYEILSPSPQLRPYLDDYLRLAELFALISNAYSDRLYVDRQLTEKTKTLLRERTTGGEVQLPGAIHELGPTELAALQASDTDPDVKVLNLKKVLATSVDKDAGAKPFLKPIGERAERLAQPYQEGQLATQQALDEFVKLAEAAVEAEKQRQELGLDPNTFAVYTALLPVKPDLSTGTASEIDQVMRRYPNARWSPDQARQLRTELYKALLPLVGNDNLVETTNALMRLDRA